MENILVALSNFNGVYPVATAYASNDLLTCAILVNVIIWSFISHLFETHKHNMSGLIHVSTELSYFLNLLDIFGVVLVFIRCYFLFDDTFLIYVFNRYKYQLCGTIILNLASEYDKESKYFYMVTHILWHLSVFYLMDLILSDYYRRARILIT